MVSAAQDALGIYVSVPFCRAKCTFCNFSSGVGNGTELQRYVTELCREIESARNRRESMGLHVPERIDTIYFGGGTPSLLEAAQLRTIFRAIRTNFVVDAEAEITLEAAPGQIAPQLLEQAQREGVNRFSLGVQSFVDPEAAAVGRLHTCQQALCEIDRLRRAGIVEIGVDLIAGLPHQTAGTWQRSLQTAASSEATHISVYMLEIDEDSRLGREVLAGGTRFHAHAVAGEDRAAELYEIGCALLPQSGFQQYEISNFARRASGHECPHSHESRHNRKYWERQPYLGFGLDAHSMLRKQDGTVLRFANSAERHDYELGMSGEKPYAVDGREAFEETVFLGLRLIDGLQLATLRATWPDPWVEELRCAATELAQEELIMPSAETLALTTRGRLLSNEVFGRLLESVSP